MASGCAPMGHWSATILGELAIKLLTERERRRGTHFFDHNVTKLIELDAKTMAEVLQIERQNEIISANEWRRKITLPRRSDPGGDEYLNPNVKSAAAQSDREAADQSAENRLAQAHKGLLVDALNRMARRVCFDARAKAKSADKFTRWLDSRAHEHREIFDEAVRPVLTAIAIQLRRPLEPLICGVDGAFFHLLLSELAPLLEPPHSANDLAENVQEVCEQFEETITEQILPLVFEGVNDEERAD